MQAQCVTFTQQKNDLNEQLIKQMRHVNSSLTQMSKTILSPLDFIEYKTELDNLENKYRIFKTLTSEGDTTLKNHNFPKNSLIETLFQQYVVIKKSVTTEFEIYWAKELINFVPRIEIVLDKTFILASENILKLRESGGLCTKASQVLINFKQLSFFLRLVDLNIGNISERLNLASSAISKKLFQRDPKALNCQVLTNDLQQLFNFIKEFNNSLFTCRFQNTNDHKNILCLPYDIDADQPTDIKERVLKMLRESKLLLAFCQKFTCKSKILLSFHFLKKHLKNLDDFFDFAPDQFSDLYSQYKLLKKSSLTFMESSNDLNHLPYTIDFNNPYFQGIVEIESEDDLINLFFAHNHADDILSVIHDKSCRLATILKYIENTNFDPFFLKDDS